MTWMSLELVDVLAIIDLDLQGWPKPYKIETETLSGDIY